MGNLKLKCEGKKEGSVRIYSQTAGKSLCREEFPESDPGAEGSVGVNSVRSRGEVTFQGVQGSLWPGSVVPEVLAAPGNKKVSLGGCGQRVRLGIVQSKAKRQAEPPGPYRPSLGFMSLSQEQ